MRRRGLPGVLALVVALCVTLAGCGGANSAEEAAKNFVGTWEVNGMVSDGEETTADDLELLKSLGMSVYLTLDEDGKASFELFGMEVEGTWEASDANTATLKFEAEDVEDADLSGEQEMKVADGTLTMEADDDVMTFVQIDPADKKSGDLGALLDSVDTSGLSDAIESVESDVASSSTSVASALSDATELDITVADDDTCTIKVTAVGDYYGDPGYAISVTNKTDGSISVDDNNEFDVNGTVASPVFSMEVDAGDTDEEVLWFENSSIGDGGVDALTNVTGKILVSNGAGEELATYDFAA